MGSIGAVIITGIIGAFTTVISGWTSWFYARKKYNSEVDNNLIENMQKSLDFYMKLSDDNRDRLSEALRRNEILEKELVELRQQLLQLMNNICFNLQCAVREKVQKIPQNDTTQDGNPLNIKIVSDNQPK